MFIPVVNPYIYKGFFVLNNEDRAMSEQQFFSSYPFKFYLSIPTNYSHNGESFVGESTELG